MNDDVKLKVGLEDKVSKGLRDIAKEINTLAKDIKGVNAPAQQSGTSFGKLTGSLISAQLATQALTQGTQLIRNEFNNAMQEAKKYTSALTGLSSVTAAFGEDQQAARDAAQSLSDDGLLAVTDSASGLKNLLGSGFGLEESINLMNAFKDAAAFNRQGTLSFGEAIVGATQGIKNQNSIMVDNVGITKNLSIILEEAGYSIQDLSRVTTDAGVRQALYNGLLREAAAFSGDAKRAADQLTGSEAQLNQASRELHTSVGLMLAPAMMIYNQTLTDVINTTNNGIAPTMNNMAKSLASFTSGIIVAIRTIKTVLAEAMMGLVGLGNMAQSIQRLDLKGATDAAKQMGADMYKEYYNYGKAVQMDRVRRDQTLREIDKNGLKNFAVAAKDMVANVGSAMSEGASKVKDNLEKESREYAQKVADMAKSFNDSLRDMVVQHRSKLKDLEKQRDEENANFSKRMEERVKMVEKERDAMTRAVEEINNKYRESIEQFRKAGQERLASLQVQLDREKALGKFADQEKVQSLQDMIDSERQSLADQEATKQELIQKEIEEVKRTHEERIAEIKNETAEMQKEHDKRLAALQAEIDAEKEIQRKYAEDFAKFKDAVAEDDIARLKRKYAEQREEEERQHQEKLQDLARRAQEEIATKAAAVVKTGGGMSTLTQQKNAATTKQQQTSKTVSLGILPVVSNLYKSPVAGSSALPRFADGGIVSRPTVAQVGEEGPEAIVPLTNPRRAAQVLAQAGMGRGVNINMPVTVISSEIDMDMLVERLAFKMEREGLL